MEPTPALWIVFLVALLIATFDNGEFPKHPTMLGARGAVNRLGSYVGGLLQILADASGRLALSAYCRFGNKTGRQAERARGE